MPGLLDALSGYLQSPDARMSLGLLSAAGPQAQPASFGQRLQGVMGQLQQQNVADEERKQKAALMQAQMADIQAQQQQRQAQAQDLQRKAEQQQRVQSLLMSQFAPTGGTQANAASGVSGPRPEAAAAIGQQPPVNYQALLAAGVPPELVKSLSEARNYGRDKVARTVEARDAQGRPVTLQQDDYGGTVGAPLQQWKAPEKMDTGGSIGMLDPVSNTLLAQFKKTNTPDALLGSETTRRGQNMTDARARDANQVASDSIGKVDWKQDANGQWIALPKEITGQGPVTPVVASGPSKRELQSQNALSIIDAAGPIIDQATNSYAGAGIDLAGRAVGLSTPGAQAGAKLKALEGALMMAQPRMEGPQSDQDVKLYRQMAGQIGDATVPSPTKQAALATIRAMHEKYAGKQPANAAPARLNSEAEYNALPPGSTYIGPDGKTRRKQ